MHIVPFHDISKIENDDNEFIVSKDDVVLSSMTYFSNNEIEKALSDDFASAFPTLVYLIENLVLHEKVILGLFLDFSCPAVYGSLRQFLETISINKNDSGFIYTGDVNKDNLLHVKNSADKHADKPFFEIMIKYVLPFFYVNKFDGKPIIDIQNPDVTSIPFHCMVDHAWAVGNNLTYALPHGIYNEAYKAATSSIATQHQFTANELYEHLKGVLGEAIDPLTLLGKPISLKIPPITSLILNKVSKPSEIGNEILEFRRKLKKSHATLKEMRNCAISEHTTIKDSLKIIKSYQQIMAELSKKCDPDNINISSFSDLITNLPKDISDGVTRDDFDYRNIIKAFINKPTDYLIKKLKYKDFSFFFDIQRQIFDLKKSSSLIKKVFGVEIPN